MTSAVGIRPGLPLGWTVPGADNLPADLVAFVQTDSSGNPVGAAANPTFIADAYTSPTAISWTSATPVNTANTVPTSGYDGVMISIVTGAGITGGTLVFEGYDGAAWIPWQAGRTNTYGGQSTFTLGASQSQGFQINIAGCTQFRTRVTGAITGTGNVVVTHLASSATMPDPMTVGLDPSQPLPAGTNNIGAVSPDAVLDAATVSGSQTAAAVVLSASTQGFAGGSFQITSIGTGNTVSFEQSNDNSNWSALNVSYGPYTSPIFSTSSANFYTFSASALYVRARVSTYGSGTVTVYLTQKRVAQQTTGQTLSAGTSVIGSTISQSGYTDSTTALGASATFTGTGRATSNPYCYFRATAYADQAGTLYIDQSLDTGATYFSVASAAVAAGVAQSLSTPMVGTAGSATLYRVRFINGGTAQGTLRLSSAFTAN